jgi:hypothetical protein
MSVVELAEQHVALLPARTVLSLLTAAPPDGTGDADGGRPGHPGSPGESVPGSGKTITYDHIEQTGTETSH